MGTGSFFLAELEKAFAKLVTPSEPGFSYPGEMDIFITGTDLDGRKRRYMDSQNRVIDDEEHRVVFHLQYRPGRKWLGLIDKKDINRTTAPKDVDKIGESDKVTSLVKQAKVLGTIARITAGFPIGFEPIKGGALPSYVQEALGYFEEDWSYMIGRGPQNKELFSLKDHSFVDGGVLDNKPFGPALRAVFHRMPGGIVKRRLFYVEPDPKPFAEKQNEGHPPVVVGYKSMVSIPGYEGIGDDLQDLIEHNQRVQWLKDLRDGITGKGKIGPIPTATYIGTRIECLCRSLVLDGNPVPAAKDYPADPVRRALFGYLIEELRGLVKDKAVNVALHVIDSYDVVFHLRRAYYFLYELYGKLEEDPENTGCKSALLLMSRIIKTLKIALDMLAEKRKQIIDAIDKSAKGDVSAISEKTATIMFEQFQSFLHMDGDHWSPIRDDLNDYPKASMRHAKDFLDSDSLTKVVKNIRAMTLEIPKLSAIRGQAEPDTILDEIAKAIDRIIDTYNNSQTVEAQVQKNAFRAVDYELYPLEFASGIYELDEIKFARISPADAQIGLSEGDQHDKVAGDQLAHFSAFLRRDWRSSDILQGRMDGICQIIESLLDEDEIKRLLNKKTDVPGILMNNSLPHCRDNTWKKVATAWNDLSSKWDGPSPWDDVTKAAAGEFRKLLILAGQEQAFYEDIGTVLEDVRYQEIKFGKSMGPLGATADTNDQTIEHDARRAAKVEMKMLSKDEQLEAYQEMHIGSQEIVGDNGQVPNVVVGEYLSAAWLMIWGMLGQTNTRVKKFMDTWILKILFYWPAKILRPAFASSRRDKSPILFLIVFLVGVALGILAIYYFQDKSTFLRYAFIGVSAMFVFVAYRYIVLLIAAIIVFWPIANEKWAWIAPAALFLMFLLFMFMNRSRFMPGKLKWKPSQEKKT